MTELLDYLQKRRGDMLADLQRFVEHESPTTDKAATDGFAGLLAGEAERLTGGRIERVEQRTWGDHLLLHVGEASGPPLLLVGHYDTVWPPGTLETMPFRLDGGRARGPGIFDMKGGLVQALWAIHALRELGRSHPPLTFLMNSDEEVGSPSSRALIERESERAAACLIFEPSFHGALKTARKGVGIFGLHVTGRPSHAGSEPFQGVSAIDEICRQVLDLHSLTNRETGTTVNVGVISGGTRGNVVAAEAGAQIDLRVVTRAEGERVPKAILGLNPHHQGATLRVEGGMNRPPMERTDRIVQLFEHARGLASDLGFTLEEASVGGGSDGNFCSTVNASVIDGLGAVGDGAHAFDEHLVVDEMAPRAALVARLLETLDAV